MVVTGFMISIGVEWTTLYLGQWWEYTAQCRSCLGSVLGLRLLLRCSFFHL